MAKDAARQAAEKALDAEVRKPAQLNDAAERARVEQGLFNEIKVESSGDTTPRARLEKRFKPTDFVRVKNIDNAYFGWLYMPASKEEVFENETSRVVLRQEPDKFVLAPGEEKVIDGTNAYVMVERLVKHLVQKRGLAKVESGEAKLNDKGNLFVGMSLPDTQDALINQIVLSIEDLDSLAQRASQPTPSVAEDLGITDDKEPEFPTVAQD